MTMVSQKTFQNLMQVVHVDTVKITNAEIKALRASPKQLVGAPGAGKFIELLGAILILDYGSNALTESADNMVIQYHTSGLDATGAIEATNFIDATADTILYVAPTAIAYNASTNLVNNAIELFNTGDGEYAGNAALDTKMIVKVAYRIWNTGL
jgi:hypothetical protein